MTFYSEMEHREIYLTPILTPTLMSELELHKLEVSVSPENTRADLTQFRDFCVKFDAIARFHKPS
jgi:hypothetical protein